MKSEGSRPSAVAILGERAAGLARPEDLVEWAVRELVAGHDSPALRGLAACSPPMYWSEVEQAFLAVLDELGLAQTSREENLRRYARLLSQQILADDTAIVLALGRLKVLWEALDHPGDLADLAYLHYAWRDLESGYETFYYPGATRENVANLVRIEAEKLAHGNQGERCDNS